MDYNKQLLFESLQSLNEASYNKIRAEFDELVKTMKGLAKEYKKAKESGDKESLVRIANDLKDMTRQKRELEDEMEAKIAGSQGTSGGDSFDETLEKVPTSFTLSELIDLGANNIGDQVRMGDMTYEIVHNTDLDEMFAINKTTGHQVPVQYK